MPEDPTERLLHVAAYLGARAGQPFTLDDLIAELPVYAADRGARDAVRRKFRRDLDDLAEQFGIAVDFDERLQQYRVRPAFFTPAERRALVVAAVYASVDPSGGPARSEVGGAVTGEAAHLFVRVPAAADALRAAIARRQVVRFGYGGRERVLEGWALGISRDRWYVAGRDRTAGALRLFRLDRVEGEPRPEGAPHAYEVPTDLDVAELFRWSPDAWGSDPPVTARVEADADVALRLAHTIGGEVIEDTAGTAVVEAETRNYAAFVDRVLEWGARVRVLEPTALVEAVTAHLEAILRREVPA